MAGEDNPAEAAKLTGLSKYFNGVTHTGRANVNIFNHALIYEKSILFSHLSLI